MFTNEKIIETKACKHCSASFEITDKDLEFYEKVSPKFGDKKYSIPPPTLCPDCRQQRRQSFKNITNLYRRTCDATWKQIISIFSPDKVYKVYDFKEWWSDRWDPMKYGRSFDFSKSFFEQYDELKKEVPHMSLYVDGNENSDYVNQAGWDKDCYLCFCTDYSEGCLYCSDVYNSNFVVDSSYCNDLENSFDCIDCKGGYKLFHCQESIKCSESSFLFNCTNCEFCFGCHSINNKKYCILNKEYSKEEYELEIKSILEKYDYDKKKIYDFLKKYFLHIPRRSYKGNNNTEFTGDYLINCKNLSDSFDNINLENSKHCFDLKGGSNCHDINRWGRTSEYCYECSAVGENTYNVLFSECSWGNISNILYSSFCCNNSSNLFGCVGLRNKQYCILNKQYTKEEYEELVPKIIEHMMTTGEWGEFFPSSISPFGYNETVAQEYYPLDRKDTINRISTDGKQIFNWSTYEAPFPKVDKIIPAKLLPENIANIPDDILNRAIMPDDECDENDVGTGFKPVPTEKQIKKPFRIIPQELEFYRKHGLPIPRKHPDQRHLDRMALRNPRKLFDRKCDKCGKEIKTTYSPDRKEIVYCEKCYKKEVY